MGRRHVLTCQWKQQWSDEAEVKVDSLLTSWYFCLLMSRRALETAAVAPLRANISHPCSAHPNATAAAAPECLQATPAYRKMRKSNNYRCSRRYPRVSSALSIEVFGTRTTWPWPEKTRPYGALYFTQNISVTRTHLSKIPRFRCSGDWSSKVLVPHFLWSSGSHIGTGQASFCIIIPEPESKLLGMSASQGTSSRS